MLRAQDDLPDTVSSLAQSKTDRRAGAVDPFHFKQHSFHQQIVLSFFLRS